ncbi:MAG: hypothetical protein J6T28_11455 [Paludibacteraceae bacterium]|nr:hypothetical protein [Paludibacteraceae bacterium]
MKLTKKKIIVLIALLVSLFPLYCVFVYFVPLNVVWISVDKEVESQLKIYLYQQRDKPSRLRNRWCDYERRELFNGEGSFFMFRQEYGEHRFLLKHDSAYGCYGFFKLRAWYDMFIRLHFYKSGDKVCCDFSQWSTFNMYINKNRDLFQHMKGTICLEGDDSLKKKLDDYACED